MTERERIGLELGKTFGLHSSEEPVFLFLSRALKNGKDLNLISMFLAAEFPDVDVSRLLGVMKKIGGVLAQRPE
jgi:hypothetical protein